MSSKAKAAKLSFSMEEDEEEVFVVKKAVPGGGDKKFKGMRQAPSAMLLVDLEKTQPTYASFGSSYNSETLEQLRSNQKFATKDSILDPAIVTEGVELSGDAAEHFVRITESLNKPEVIDAVEMEVEEAEGGEDFIAFHRGHKDSKAILKGRSNNRVYTTAREKKEFFDLEAENDSDWEEQVMRRGAISSQLGAQLSTRLSSNVLVSGADGNSSTVTLADTVKLVQLAIEKLTLSVGSGENRVSLLTSTQRSHEQEQVGLRESLGRDVEKLNIIEDVRLYFATLVGLLREKSSMIDELQEAALSTVRAIREEARRERVCAQEDLLYRVKAAGELMAIGEYEPTGVMLVSGTEYGALLAALPSREAARQLARRGALQTHLVAHPEVSVSESDSGWFAADRIDEVSSDDTRRAMYVLDRSILDTYHSASPLDSAVASKLAILHAAWAAIMEDAEPEAFAVDQVVARLTAFRERFPERYRSAFISLSLPEILRPLLRYDILAFSGSLFRGAAASSSSSSSVDENNSEAQSSCNLVISERPWHEPLREFSSSGAAGSEQEGGASIEALVDEGDSRLLPKLVAEVVLPWCTAVTAASLDPLSPTACAACADLLGQLLDYDVSAEQLSPLLEAVVAAFTAELCALCLPVVKHIAAGSESDAAGGGKSFALRQLRRVALYLRNLAVFRDFLTPQVVMRTAWKALAGSSIATVRKLLSASEFGHVDVVLELLQAACVLIDGDSADSTNSNVVMAHERLMSNSGVAVAAYKEVKIALAEIAHIGETALTVNDTRQLLQQAMSKI